MIDAWLSADKDVPGKQRHTRSGLVSKARSIKRPPPQAFAAAATLACPKRT